MVSRRDPCPQLLQAGNSLAQLPKPRVSAPRTHVKWRHASSVGCSSTPTQPPSRLEYSFFPSLVLLAAGLNRANKSTGLYHTRYRMRKREGPACISFRLSDDGLLVYIGEVSASPQTFASRRRALFSQIVDIFHELLLFPVPSYARSASKIQ